MVASSPGRRAREAVQAADYVMVDWGSAAAIAYGGIFRTCHRHGCE
jgi:hypothetical protein